MFEDISTFEAAVKSGRIQLTTDFNVLMQHAYALGQAKRSKDPVKLEIAQKAHDDYACMVRLSTAMMLKRPVSML